MEISPTPASISDEELEDNVCKAFSISLSVCLSVCLSLCLSLTGHEVIPDDLQACHHLKKRRL